MPDSFMGLFPEGGLTPTGCPLGISAINQFMENVTKHVVAGTGILAKVISQNVKVQSSETQGQ